MQLLLLHSLLGEVPVLVHVCTEDKRDHERQRILLDTFEIDQVVVIVHHLGVGGHRKYTSHNCKGQENNRSESSLFTPHADTVDPKLYRNGEAHRRVDETTVWMVLFNQSQQKAPGPDRINSSALRLLWSWDASRVTALIWQCIRLGYHPKPWKRVMGVMLCKPNKLDYTTVKSYHVISPLNCLS